MISRRSFLYTAASLVECTSAFFLFSGISEAENASGSLKAMLMPGTFSPICIVVPIFSGDLDLGAEISKIVANNLRLSGYFVPIDNSMLPDRVIGIGSTPDFAYLKLLRAHIIVTASVVRTGASVILQVKIWDLIAEKLLAARQLKASADNVSRLSHVLSDQIYTAVTGFGGLFDSRLAYIAEFGDETSRSKRLRVSDWNGLNGKYFTDADSLILSPRFNATGDCLVYTALSSTFRPRIMAVYLDNGTSYPLFDERYMTYAPSFSPDGKSVVFSVQVHSAAHIYSMDIRSRAVVQLTSGISIDTSPCFSADGSQIVFESDRSGEQQIYTMECDGSRQSRVSFGAGKYATPVWSPDLSNPLIAFTKRYAGSFGIGIIRPDGSGERILSYGYHCEGPTWSPNGRHIMFFKEGFEDTGTMLAMLDIFGNGSSEMPISGYGSDPFWSARIL